MAERAGWRSRRDSAACTRGHEAARPDRSGTVRRPAVCRVRPGPRRPL